MKKSILLIGLLLAGSTLQAITVHLANWSKQYTIIVNTYYPVPPGDKLQYFQLDSKDMKLGVCKNPNCLYPDFERSLFIKENVEEHDYIVLDAGKAFWQGLPGKMSTASVSNDVRYTIIKPTNKAYKTLDAMRLAPQQTKKK
jgi:hypothetical protein